MESKLHGLVLTLVHLRCFDNKTLFILKEVSKGLFCEVTKVWNKKILSEMKEIYQDSYKDFSKDSSEEVQIEHYIPEIKIFYFNVSKYYWFNEDNFIDNMPKSKYYILYMGYLKSKSKGMFQKNQTLKGFLEDSCKYGYCDFCCNYGPLKGVLNHALLDSEARYKDTLCIICRNECVHYCKKCDGEIKIKYEYMIKSQVKPICEVCD